MLLEQDLHPGRLGPALEVALAAALAFPLLEHDPAQMRHLDCDPDANRGEKLRVAHHTEQDRPWSAAAQWAERPILTGGPAYPRGRALYTQARGEGRAPAAPSRMGDAALCAGERAARARARARGGLRPRLDAPPL